MTDSAAELLAAGWEAVLEAAFRGGGFWVAEAKLTRARDIVTDHATEAAVLDRLGWLLHFQALEGGRDTSRVDNELALFQRAADIRWDIGDLGGVAASVFGVGLVHQVLRGDWGTAMPAFLEALALAEHTDVVTRSEIHRHVGFYYLVENVQLDKAVEHLRISLDLRHRSDDKRWLPSGTLALGWVEAAAGHRDAAVRLMRTALAEAHAVGLRPSLVASIEESLRQAESG